MDISIIVSLSSVLISLVAIAITLSSNNRQDKYSKANQMRELYNDFRDIYTSILGDKNVAQKFADERNLNLEDVKLAYDASFLINQAYLIFLYNEAGLYPKDVWEHLKIDIFSLFKVPFVKERWNHVHQLYSMDFNKFINN